MDMKKSFLLKVLLISAVGPWLAGCVERQVVYRDRPVYVQPPPGTPPPDQAVVAAPAQPPPQEEIITTAPDPTFIWIGGEVIGSGMAAIGPTGRGPGWFGCMGIGVIAATSGSGSALVGAETISARSRATLKSCLVAGYRNGWQLIAE